MNFILLLACIFALILIALFMHRWFWKETDTIVITYQGKTYECEDHTLDLDWKGILIYAGMGFSIFGICFYVAWAIYWLVYEF